MSTPANPGSILEFTFEPGGMFRMVQASQDAITDEKPMVDIYPNPAQNYFVLYNYKQLSNVQIELADMNGRKIKQIKTSALATRIDCSQFASGLYLVTLRDRQGQVISNRKILIQH
jgi:hypothetical protein